jgi:CIC family chloride channel protein
VTRQQQREYAKLGALAVFVSLVVAFLAVLFRYLIDWIFDTTFATPGELLDMSIETRLWYVIIPAIGGLIVGPLIWWGAREARMHGVPEVMDAVLRFGGRIRMRVVAVKGLAAAVTIGTGGSAGREGPIVHMGSGLGSNVGQVMGLTSAQTKILLGCGAAAGITATFNTPIAGVLFAIELILMEFKTRSFIPLVIASVIATMVAPAFDASLQYTIEGEWPEDPWSRTPAFSVPQDFTLDNPWELAAYLGLGIICGLLALLFITFLYKTEDFFNSLKTKRWLKPAIGGLLLGGVGLLFPWVYGIGYGSIEDVLNNRFLEGWTLSEWAFVGMMSVLALVKILGVSLTLGSGSSGGVFAPALFIGAMAGGAYGVALGIIFPGSTASYGAYALVAMAALVAASTRGTLTAILMIFEMTRVYDIILPLLFACVIADMVATLGSPETIYTRKLLRRGVMIVQDLEPNVMQLFAVKDVMVPREDVVTISPDDALHKVVAIIRRSGHNGFPVLDEEGKLVGVVTHEDTRNAHNRGDLFLKAEDLMTTDMVSVTPYDTGEVALRRMGGRHISHLPVVDPYDETKLMGWISKGDLVFAYEDYHHRMEAPISDHTLEMDDGEPDQVKPLEETLEPPSLLGRLLGRRTSKQADVPEAIEVEEPPAADVDVSEPMVADKWEVEVVEEPTVKKKPKKAPPAEPRSEPVKVEKVKGRRL